MKRLKIFYLSLVILALLAAIPSNSFSKEPVTSIRKESTRLFREGMDLYRSGNFEAALMRWEELSSLDPTNRRAKAYIKKAEYRIEKAGRQKGIEKDIAAERKPSKEEEKKVVKEKSWWNPTGWFKKAASKEEPAPAAIVEEDDLDVEEAKVLKAAEVEPSKEIEEVEAPEVEDIIESVELIKSVDEILLEEEEPLEVAISGNRILTLDDCLEIATKNHIPLKTADEQVKLGRMRLREARRALLPTLTVKYDQLEGVISNAEFEGTKYSIEGQQPIYRGGELKYTLKQAKLNHEIARKNRDKIKNDLILKVKDAFYGLLKAKRNIGYQKDVYERVDIIAGIVVKGYEDGVISQLELLDIKSQKNQADFQLLSAEQTTSLAVLALQQAMSVDPGEEFDIAGELAYKKIDIRYDKCLDLAMRHRPDLLISGLLMEYNDYEKRIAFSKGQPHVDLTGSLGRGGEAYTFQHLKFDDEWYVGVKATWPIGGSTGEYSYTKEKLTPSIGTYHGTESLVHSWKFSVLDDLKYFSRRQEADVEYSKSLNELNKTKNQVVMDVRESYFNYKKALVQMDTAISKLRFQEMEVAVLEAKKGMDEATYSELISSYIKMAQEKYSQIQSLTGYYTAIASLNKAIGIDDYFNIE
ncbi:MAG: TolC family protein [Candidatus Omnitrophica bacterium]|nr:TolC family protein [Candidatus Omnitrophota bacterium]